MTRCEAIIRDIPSSVLLAETAQQLQLAAVTAAEEAVQQSHDLQQKLEESRMETSEALESKDMALAVADEEVCRHTPPPPHVPNTCFPAGNTC